MNDYIKRQLLCTFSNVKDFEGTSKEIMRFYKIYNDRIFAFSNEKVPHEIYLTYNVLDMKKEDEKFLNTILIHRKKHTNTLYTLNAMNKLIEEENGHMDKTFVVQWELYKNSLIITGDVSVRIIPLKIVNVFGQQ
jgi:hypothetical protein